MNLESVGSPQREEAITQVFLTTNGKIVAPSCRHFIYGGHDIREGSLNNLWMIDMAKFEDLKLPEEQQDKSCEWKLIETRGRQKPGKTRDCLQGIGHLAHHSSVVFGDKMYLFGGSNLEKENNLFLALDLKSYDWTVVVSRV
jgi:hypothetical protein